MISPRKLKFYGIRDLNIIPHLQKLSDEDRFEIDVVSHVLPFRTNSYVIEELIDWDNVPDDPIFQLNFMQKGMLLDEHYEKMADVIRSDASREEIIKTANEIRLELNPHPAGQMTANVPIFNGEVVPGIQHKYKEICLIFPSAGQTCHAYCTFCFRWVQFVGLHDLKFATDESKKFQNYIKEHKELTDVLITGGDPMVMSLAKLETYIEPLLQPEFKHIQNIRIGTKSVTYWPYRFLTDKDADGILRLFEKAIKAGKHIALMAHINHWVELQTDAVHEAVKRLREVGVEIRTQSPIIKHINDDADIWAKMWRDQVKLGMIPYYMFVERDTGANQYFEVPLSRAFEIFRDAYNQVSGLQRTVRGPSMSSTPGKVVIEGIAEINGEKVFVLNMLQARNPDWVKRPFFAKYDETSMWLNHLTPAFGEDKFFYEDELESILRTKAREHHKSEASFIPSDVHQFVEEED